MRTIHKSYADYGITKAEKKYIKAFCRNADENEQSIIKKALSELSPYISDKVFDSLVNNLSYEKLCEKEYMYMCKDIFYGHRRHGMACIKRWMIMYGIWEM